MGAIRGSFGAPVFYVVENLRRKTVDKHIVTIPIETDVDPSTILEIAQGFHKLVREHTSEDCDIDEDEVSVESVG